MIGSMLVPSRLPGAILGGGYLMVGVLGLNAPGGTLLTLFTADLARSWLHLGLGAILLVGATAGGRCGVGANLLAGSLAGVAGALGLALSEATTADSVLHLGTALLLLVLGLGTAAAPAAPAPAKAPAEPGSRPRLTVASYCGR